MSFLEATEVTKVEMQDLNRLSEVLAAELRSPFIKDSIYLFARKLEQVEGLPCVGFAIYPSHIAVIAFSELNPEDYVSKKRTNDISNIWAYFDDQVRALNGNPSSSLSWVNIRNRELELDSLMSRVINQYKEEGVSLIAFAIKEISISEPS